VSAVAISSVKNLGTQLPLRRKDMGCASVESIGGVLVLETLVLVLEPRVLVNMPLNC